MNTFLKLVRLGVRSIKVFATMASSIALAFSGVSIKASAELSSNTSPLLSQTQASQASIAKIVDAIKSAAGGTITAQNSGMAVNEAIAANPGVSLEMIAAALNQLGLTGPALVAAVDATSTSFKEPTSKVLTAMITNTYMNSGKSAAHTQISALRGWFPKEVVDAATDDQLAVLQSLTDIEPAGGDDGVYNG